MWNSSLYSFWCRFAEKCFVLWSAGEQARPDSDVISSVIIWTFAQQLQEGIERKNEVTAPTALPHLHATLGAFKVVVTHDEKTEILSAEHTSFWYTPISSMAMPELAGTHNKCRNSCARPSSTGIACTPTVCLTRQPHTTNPPCCRDRYVDRL